MGSITTFPYTTPGNYTYDTSKIEINGVVAKLVNQFTAHQTLNPAIKLAMSYNQGVTDADYGDGTLTTTETGSPSVASGKLELDAGGDQYVDYNADNFNVDTTQTGAIRVIGQPNYTGFPTGNHRVLFSLSNGSGSINNLIALRHRTDGQLQMAVYDSTGTAIAGFQNLGNWSPTTGQEYEFELNWDINGNGIRCFRDGVQIGSTNFGTGTRTSAVTLLRVGDQLNSTQGNSGWKINEFLLFDSVQHTANYTPIGTVLPETVYATDGPSILTNSIISASELIDFIEVVTKSGSDDIKYTINIGGIDYYWDGGAVVVSDCTFAQANTADEIADNAVSFLSLRSSIKVKALLHSDDGSTTPELDSVSVEYNTSVPDATLNNIRQLVGFIYDHTGAPVSGQDIRVRPYRSGRVTNEVFTYYKYQFLDSTDAEGFFAGDIMVLDSENETEIKIGPQSYRAVLPDQETIDIKDLTLVAIEDD